MAIYTGMVEHCDTGGLFNLEDIARLVDGAVYTGRILPPHYGADAEEWRQEFETCDGRHGSAYMVFEHNDIYSVDGTQLEPEDYPWGNAKKIVCVILDD